MSFSLGRRFLTQFSGSRIKEFSRAIIARSNYSTTVNEKSTEKENTVEEKSSICGAVLKRFCEPVVLENLNPMKDLRPNEVLIDVHYCALNPSDALLSRNMYTFEPHLPMILGYEMIGKLVQVGEDATKNGYKVGDKVIALNKDNYGGLAEQCVADVVDIWKVPSAMKSLDAVSLLDNYITALIALERKVSIQEDDMILINIGVSGIGLAAVDLLTNVFRAKVISVCATEECADLARDKGAFASLKFKGRKLLKQIEGIAAEKDIKAIFNDEGGDYFKKVLDSFTDIYKEGTTLKDLLRDDNFAVVEHHLSREGRVIIAGSAAIMDADGQTKTKEGSFRITGFNLTEYRKRKPEVYRQAGDDIFQFFDEGLVKPSCSLIVGLNKVNEAIEFVLDKKSAAKVIVDIRNKDAGTENLKK